MRRKECLADLLWGALSVLIEVPPNGRLTFAEIGLRLLMILGPEARLYSTTGARSSTAQGLKVV